MDPCPGCSLSWFSGRESGGGKVHLFFFIEVVVLVPDFIYIYHLPVKKAKENKLGIAHYYVGAETILVGHVTPLVAVLHCDLWHTDCFLSGSNPAFSSYLPFYNLPWGFLTVHSIKVIEEKNFSSQEKSCYFLLLQHCLVHNTGNWESKINSNT